jgi:hypothetical protein
VGSRPSAGVTTTAGAAPVGDVIEQLNADSAWAPAQHPPGQVVEQLTGHFEPPRSLLAESAGEIVAFHRVPEGALVSAAEPQPAIG